LKGLDHWREVDFSLAEHKVLVDAGPHVLDVDVDEPIGPIGKFLGDWQLPLAVEVADVDGQLDSAAIDTMML
jgi:hypothetical protein